MIEELFTAKIRWLEDNTKSRKGIIVPQKNLDMEDLNVGDMVKVYIRKLPGDHGEGD